MGYSEDQMSLILLSAQDSDRLTIGHPTPTFFQVLCIARPTTSAPGLLLAICAGGSTSPWAGPYAPSSPVVLSLQQLKLVFDAVARVRGREFELLG